MSGYPGWSKGLKSQTFCSVLFRPLVAFYHVFSKWDTGCFPVTNVQGAGELTKKRPVICRP